MTLAFGWYSACIHASVATFINSSDWNVRISLCYPHILEVCVCGRSQWPRGVRDEPFSPAGTLGPWVWVPLEACMSVCIYSLIVLLCVYIAALRGADLPSKESYGLCIGLRSWKSGQGQKDYKTIEREIIYSIYRMSQEECARLREGVPYFKVCRYNPKSMSKVERLRR
jgi:hypothetical protein